MPTKRGFKSSYPAGALADSNGRPAGFGWRSIIVTRLTLNGETLAALLSEAGIASNRIEKTLRTALAKTRHGDNRPTLLLLSGNRWNKEDIYAIAELKQRLKNIEIVVSGDNITSASIDHLENAGVGLILSRSISKATLCHYINLVLLGERIHIAREGRYKSTDKLPPLTRREREIAELLRDGLSDKEISRELRISSGTASIHIHNIRRKLRLRNRTQVAIWAVRRLAS